MMRRIVVLRFLTDQAGQNAFDIAPRPDEPVVRGQAANGFDGTVLDTILRVAGVDTLVLFGIATDVAVESTARAASDLPRVGAALCRANGEVPFQARSL
ncbi:MAG TPA: isochorismatase family protein [Xanthobacteraceae bacterium]